MTKDKTVHCVADVKAVLGEGPVWVAEEQALYWVDIKGRKIFRLDEKGARTEWETPFRVGSIAPRGTGGFIAGTDKGFASIDLRRKRFDLIGNPEEDRPDNRFNDGKVDRDGRFWAGTMDDTEQAATGALYRLDAAAEGALTCTRMDDGYRVTNGPAFSPGGRLIYHTDSARQIIYVFDLDEEGGLGERQVFARFEENDGYPDGMTVDAEGCLWVAFWDGWCVRRFSPAGECILTLDLPVQRPTSVAFGGPQLDRLYITSASIGLDALALSMQPYAGGLFLTTPGVVGVAGIPFAG
ncbi:MAG TPA: SMP-30/gluconolactonase/LRE family protein [Allosphingosinicella sp.]|nr:SMP-30/gluconolactonase/LRE family protein [Allosphingosinicella sp.]